MIFDGNNKAMVKWGLAGIGLVLGLCILSKGCSDDGSSPVANKRPPVSKNELAAPKWSTEELVELLPKPNPTASHAEISQTEPVNSEAAAHLTEELVAEKSTVEVSMGSQEPIDPLCNRAVPTVFHDDAESRMIVTNVINVQLDVGVMNVSSIVEHVDGMRPSGPDPDEATRKEEALRKEREAKAVAALFYINHISQVVTRIKTYNDPKVLEDEYEAISLNTIRLDSINDEEVIDLIEEIMDYITDMRIQERERAMLKEELDQGMSDAMFDALSGLSCAGTTPIGAVFSLITSAANAAVNYKRAKTRIMKEFHKQEWALDKEKMVELNHLNKRLLRNYWLLVKRYSIPDPFRVTDSDISRFYERLKDDDPEMRYRFLLVNERTYRYMPTYWFYRGFSAYECGRKDDALASLESFQTAQEKYAKILRIDSHSAKAAMLRIQLMLDKSAGEELDPSVIRHQLDTILENTTVEDWTLRYFCATVCASYLRDFSGADAILSPVIDEFESKRKSNLVNWCDLMETKQLCQGTNVVERAAVSGDALYECKTLVARLGEGKMTSEERDKRLSEICNSSYASAREKLFCYGSMGFDRALDALRPDLGRMFVYRQGSDLCLALPLSWAMSREGEMAVHISTNNVDLGTLNLVGMETKEASKERDIIGDPDESKYSVVQFKEVPGDCKVVLTMRYLRGRPEEGECLQVALMFNLSESENGRVKPQAAAIGRWSVYKARGQDGQVPHWVKVKSVNLNER